MRDGLPSRDAEGVTPSAPLSPARSARDPRRRHRRRIVATAITVGAVTAVVAGGVVAADVYGPRFGFYVVPPSVPKYAEIAVGLLDGGYHSDSPQWPVARAALLVAAETADEYADLYPLLDEAVGIVGGRHSQFVPAGDDGTSNDESSRAAPTVETVSGVTTIVLPEMISPSPEDQKDYALTVADGIDRAAAATCGWVVDLRGNTGGTMFPMLSAVTALLPDGTALSFRDRAGDVAPVKMTASGVVLSGTQPVDVGARAKVAAAPIAVLQDEWTASSGEAVLIAFRGLSHVRTFGVASAGYTSANVSRSLFDGAALVLTESVYVDRDGRDYSEGSIPPDQTPGAEGAEAAAGAWLREQGCAR